jgi:probable selenium-dependent hydroxylase accessory protein YqeC
MLVTGGDSHKITGPHPEDLDRFFLESALDFLVVEADGAHGRPLKAPADHEPVVPSMSTVVVIAIGVDAVGMRLDEASHRVERATAFSGLAPGHLLTAADCAAILVHPSGALRVAPEAARVVVAITKVSSPDQQAAAGEIANRVVEHPRVDEAILIPDSP